MCGGGERKAVARRESREGGRGRLLEGSSLGLSLALQFSGGLRPSRSLAAGVATLALFSAVRIPFDPNKVKRRDGLDSTSKCIRFSGTSVSGKEE